MNQTKQSFAESSAESARAATLGESHAAKPGDSIVRALLFDGCVSITAIRSTRLVDRAIVLHGLSPVCAAALGRTMTASAVLASELKNDSDKLTVTIKGGGEIGSVVVSCDKKLNVRGCVGNSNLMYPLNDRGKLDVARAVGTDGTLTVVKDLGLKEPYVGTSRLVSGEIGEDFAQYFLESEQQASAVALGVLIGNSKRKTPEGAFPCKCESAGGFIIRVLPFCPDDVLKKTEEKLSQFAQVSAMMKGKSAEAFLTEYFSDCGLEILETFVPRYHCKCSVRSIEALLHTLKYEELKTYAKEDGQVEIHCHFCNRRYAFAEQDIDRIFQRKE